MSETTLKGNALLRGERLQVMLEAEELQVVDDFRFKFRLPSRAAAVRELLRRGLQATGFQIEQPTGAASSAFGIVDKADGADPSNDIST